MCDFSEPFFGAPYPDACCIDGYLWDLDSCSVPGGPLCCGGETACPQCNTISFLEQVRDDCESGYSDPAGAGPEWERAVKYARKHSEQDVDAILRDHIRVVRACMPSLEYGDDEFAIVEYRYPPGDNSHTSPATNESE